MPFAAAPGQGKLMLARIHQRGQLLDGMVGAGLAPNLAKRMVTANGVAANEPTDTDAGYEGGPAVAPRMHRLLPPGGGRIKSGRENLTPSNRPAMPGCCELP